MSGADAVGQANFEVLKQSVLSYVLPQMGNGALHVRIIYRIVVINIHELIF